MIALGSDHAGYDLKMAVAPWSPPRHMKTNDNMNNGLHENLFENNHNYIIMIRKGCNGTEYKVLEKALVELLEK